MRQKKLTKIINVYLGILSKVKEEYKLVKTNWQIEKEQRIKPSLWWEEVSKAQASQTESGSQTDTNTPKPTNLSTDGKAWFTATQLLEKYNAGDVDDEGYVNIS